MDQLDLHISDGNDHLLIVPKETGTADLILSNGEMYADGKGVVIGHLRPDEMTALIRWASTAVNKTT